MQDERLRKALGYALVRAFRRVNRAHNRALKRFGLSAEQAHVLLVLWLEGPLKVGELGALLQLSSGTLTGAIDRMERAGLVKRVADPEDGRAWILAPARIDPKKQKAIIDTLGRTEDECFGELNERSRAELLELLERVGG